MFHPTSTELDVRDYLRTLNSRKRVVAVAIVAVVGVSLVLSYLQSPVYSATSRVLLEPTSSNSPFGSTGASPSNAIFFATELEVLKSQQVQTEVKRALGSAPSISASIVRGTAIVSITALSGSAKRAAEIANAYPAAYIELRRKETVDGLLAASDEIQKKIVSLQQQIDALGANTGGIQPVPGSVAAGQEQTLAAQQALFQGTLDKLTVDANLASGGARLVASAVVPRKPIRPTPVRNAMLALVLGVVLGIGLAFLFDYFDDSVDSREELERFTRAVPVIGGIPLVDSWKSKEETRLVSRAEPRSPAAEAYRTVRTAIQFIGLDRPLRTLMISSAGVGEGKTTTLANLGVALATAGQRVTLVCCDLRRPRLHRFFDLQNDVGFTSLLLGEVPISQALQTVPWLPRLTILTSGPRPPNPSELLSSERTKEVFDALSAQADIVLVDSPPILPVTDALVLSRWVDGALMVFSANTTTRKQVTRSLAEAQQVGTPLIGAVLNRVRPMGGYGYPYRYAYYGDHTNGHSGNGAPQTNGARIGVSGSKPEKKNREARHSESSLGSGS
jgi:polysaccharide biosynthesis transport protein